MPYSEGCDRFHLGTEITAFRVNCFTGRTLVSVASFTPGNGAFRAL